MEARYTKGPEALEFDHPNVAHFARGTWREVDEKHREQLLLPDRVAEYGFEVRDASPELAAAAV